MSSKRINVLVYAGNGTTAGSVFHTTWTLKRILGPNYAVVTVTGDQLINEPWTTSCALLVIPGGADMAYSRALNGVGNRRIKQYVQMGGAYLGLCAGGYFGSARCEFEEGNVEMEVVGDRELAFFPGVCRGLAFPGFKYNSEVGTRAAHLSVNKAAFTNPDFEPRPNLRAYYNGGGVFVDAHSKPNVEILASYTENIAVDGGDGEAAVVFCTVGDGKVVLTGPHPEFSGLNLDRNEKTGPADYDKVVDALVADEAIRMQFMKACIAKLGLSIESKTTQVPRLSELHLSAAESGHVAELVHSWSEAGVITVENGQDMIRGENDTFAIYQNEENMITSITSAIRELVTSDKSDSADDKIKHIIGHEQSHPSATATPHFDQALYFSQLGVYHSRLKNTDAKFGCTLIYGEVVTSTSTMLEKNVTWLSHLPDGFTATATTQVAGRGRGTNVWVSPPGSLMFSTVLRHSLALSNTAPVVFIQYLAALAIVAGVHQYERGYEKLPVRLKWPNDVYALDPNATGESYVKIGGILVNSSYAGGDYTLVCGIGLNTNNTAPTTSVSMLAQKAGLPAIKSEKLLASILSQFELLHTRFCRTGFDGWFEQLYYRHWLHSDQIVTLETENGARARIKGITRDWGLLLAEELGWEDRLTGRTFQLQSDSNSFDFFKGLLKRKI